MRLVSVEPIFLIWVIQGFVPVLVFFFHYIAKDWCPCKGFHFHSCLHLDREIGIFFLGDDQLRYRDFLVAFSSYSLSSACPRGNLVRQLESCLAEPCIS